MKTKIINQVIDILIFIFVGILMVNFVGNSIDDVAHLIGGMMVGSINTRFVKDVYEPSK